MINQGSGFGGFPGSTNDFESLSRQYWGAWGDMLRNVATGVSPPDPVQAGTRAWQDSIAWWTQQASGRPAHDDVLSRFNRQAGDWYAQMQQACASGTAQGWLCQRENGGIRWGRVFEASAALGDFSVDVVQMKNIAGPHHSHPLGEIDLILPITPDALFDGHAAGWCVYGPQSAHSPTVSNGEAWVLYLLPQGQIQFTRRAA